MTTSSNISKFTNLDIARNCVRTADRKWMLGMIKGDDGKIWVVTAKDWSRLVKAGYESID